ncbi:hypothetical protein D9M72_612870 [compost metagenome]
MQVDRVAVLTTHLPTGNVDAVLHQEVENVPKDTDAVLAMDFDAHGKAHDADGRRSGRVTLANYLLRRTNTWQEYVTDVGPFNIASHRISSNGEKT